MAPAHFRPRLRSGSQAWLGASIVLLAVGSVAWLGPHAPRATKSEAASPQATPMAQAKGSPRRPTLSAAQRARAAQTHLLAVRAHEAALRQRNGLPEDRARWDHALASTMRAVHSVRHAPGGEQLGPQVKGALAQLAAYAELVGAPAPGAVARPRAAGPASSPDTTAAARAAERLDAAWQELQTLATRGS